MTKKPWVMAKDEALEDEVQAVCSVGINLFRVLATYLKPVSAQDGREIRGFPKVFYRLDGP